MTQKAQADVLRKLQSAAARATKHMPAPLPGLFALTDPERTPNPIALANALFEGCGLIYRHFGAENREIIARQLAKIARDKRLVFLIGNDAELARAVGADGVHWAEARIVDAPEWRARFKLMTAAAHSEAAIAQAAKMKLDAALVSSVFPSKSPSARSPLGVDTFRSWAQSAALPLYALGGVNTDTIAKIEDFAGAAMIGGLEGLITPNENQAERHD